ncbi:3-keto sterol reductase [Kwoniella mangroviensis CBS 8886]|nr:3-keto sterol reductase [Kwoniella mangroviensis CBS 8886]
MVSTRSGSSKLPKGVERDDNRIIVVVTGANSGFGLGICEQLLSNLSLPPSTSIPISTPQLTALPPSLRNDFNEDELDEPTKYIEEDPPTLTLILACRSEAKALEARRILLDKHEQELRERQEISGEEVRKGWKEGLRIVWEGVDLDNPGGGNGVLGFCERLKTKYPHITTLYLNAGMGAFSGLDWIAFFKQNILEGLPQAQSLPKYQYEIKGAMSSDGERGLVWGTNVLAPYIMAQELIPLLRRSPPSLPFQPRIIYTSSCTSSFSKLSSEPLNDYQLINYEKSYSASKYMGDLIMAQLDKQYGSSSSTNDEDENQIRPVRAFTADPGCVATNLFMNGFGFILWWVKIKFFFYHWSFVLCRLMGSTKHPVYADQGALPMLYAALIPDRYILPSTQNPAQRFAVISQRWGDTKVGYEEVDEWEKGDELGKGFMEACESHRREWRRREGLE